MCERHRAGDSECVKKLLDCILLHHHFLCHQKNSAGHARFPLTHTHKQIQTRTCYPIHPSVNISRECTLAFFLPCFYIPRWIPDLKHCVFTVSGRETFSFEQFTLVLHLSLFLYTLPSFLCPLSLPLSGTGCTECGELRCGCCLPVFFYDETACK